MNEEKRLLRKRLREEYCQIPQWEKTHSDRCLFERISVHPLFCESKRVFLYVSVGNEADTYALLKACMDTGKEVALPRCYDDGIMEFYRYDGALRTGKHGIPEPVSDELMVPQTGDLMIVPGLAFAPNCYRMGQGGGYYDRYLAKYPCVTLGICRDRFLLNDIPVVWNDLPVSCVITETSFYENKNGAS